MNDEIIGVITDVDDMDASMSEIEELSVSMEIPAATGTMGIYEIHIANVDEEEWELVDITYADIVDAYEHGKELRLISDTRGVIAYFVKVSEGAFAFNTIDGVWIIEYLIGEEQITETAHNTTESDPTVPSWAKENTKPSYTASEVGALPDNTSIPSKTSDLQNDSGFISTETDPTVPQWAKAAQKPTYTASEVGALPDNTPIPSKVSDLQNDSGFITTETDPTVPQWAKAAQKPTYTASEVGALPDNTSIPSKTSDLQNDSGFISTETDPTVPSWAKAQNKPSYSASEVGAIPSTEKGANSGVCPLNSSGKIDASYLPVYNGGVS